MSDLALRADSLSKLYRIGRAGDSYYNYKSLREAITNVGSRITASLPFTNSRSVNGNVDSAHIWALQDVSFEVRTGDVIGVIGRNGAGKSTLLKILSRITQPTGGSVEIRGRVGSLLEVGTGFHPELTGRENIYLNGAILGMKKAEIKRKFDEMVAFSGIEKFLDTPVKFYSTGMHVRLAFSVAAHLEPEILLVDEVLAVGDAAFQKKCLGKMSNVAREGRTVLLVSHNMQAIWGLTKRTLVLEKGQLVFEGETPSAVSHYRSLWQSVANHEYVDARKSTGVRRAKVITSEPNQTHRFGERLKFEFEVSFKEKPKSGVFTFQVVDEEKRPVMNLWLFDSEQHWSRAGNIRLRCTILKPRIYMGHYSLITHLGDPASKQHFETVEDICPFEVVMDGTPREPKWIKGACTFLEDAEWSSA